MRVVVIAFALALAGPRSSVRADVVEDCPRGQHFESNPMPEGAIHHGGGRCVDDPGGGCSVGAPATPAPGAVVAAGLATVVVLAVRRRA